MPLYISLGFLFVYLFFINSTLVYSIFSDDSTRETFLKENVRHQRQGELTSEDIIQSFRDESKYNVLLNFESLWGRSDE